MSLTAQQRDIARRALQSALAGAAAYWATRITGTGEAFLAVIAAVLVLETNRGETRRSAFDRIVGALIGAGVGGLALIVTDAGAGPIALAIALFVTGGIAAWRPGWSYGIVVAAGLAMETSLPFWDAAATRLGAVAIGILSAVAVGYAVWPESTRKRARRQMSEALSLCRDLLDSTLSSALAERRRDVHDLHRRFLDTIAAGTDTARAIRPARGGGHYRDLAHRIERLWHALIILDRVTETQHGDLPLRRETIAQVRSIQSATCEALSCAARFERIPKDDLDTLGSACGDIWKNAHIDPDREDELQSVALVFGLGEVSRNMREIDQAICEIAKTG